MKQTSILLLCISVLSSCGIRPGTSPSNLPLPTAFAQRDVFPTDLAGGYSFHDYVGGIVLIKDNEQPTLIHIIRPNSFKPEIIPIPETSAYYKSRITKGASVQGSYLKIAASLQADQMMEIEIIDIARANIDFSDIKNYNEVVEQAEAWVKTHPKANDGYRRIWIKEITMSKNVTNSATKIKANTSGSVGPVTKIEAGIYNTSENQNRSIQLGLVAFDIDKLVSNSKGIKALTGETMNQSLTLSQDSGFFTNLPIKK